MIRRLPQREIITKAVVSKVLELRKSALQSPDSRKKMDYYVELAHIALKWAQEVKDTASQLGVGKECKGIVSNSDLAPTYPHTSPQVMIVAPSR